MMGAPDANKGRPSLLGSNEPTTAASPAASGGESTRVLAQLGGRNADKRSFIKRPGVWATLVLLIGVGGAATYQLQSRRADTSVNVAVATPANPTPAVVAAPPKPEAPVVTATAPSSATPEPTPARIVESDTPPPQQQQSTPFAAIGAQPMAVQPAGKSTRVAAKPPAKSTARTDKTTATAAAKKPEHVASKQPARTASNNKPVKTAANGSKTPRRANDTTQASSRPGKPDPDTDLLSALLKRSKTSDPAPQPSALTEVAADCKSGQRCKP
ncbi:hypothetical protein [Variovorax sp. PAMC26660]|uniref:hypothetical protein n=1 Tax=Variovorax sp. PAMC26660 TaxID=2762322 RepID=UPI00164CFBC8|nr:hypothetical protein [Variovorax sp. PAMC26660]QNK67117.1 hypothetical protein H7F35_28785 [Variovorax sp. PAMC26660]